jgi:cytochrome P450
MPLPLFVPTPANLQLTSAVNTLREVVLGIIQTRRSQSPKGDLLSMLLNAVDPSAGGSLDDGEILDEVMSLIMAGHETTATALSWSLYLLALNPSAAKRVRDEVEATLSCLRPTAADLPRLRYTAMVVEESMRLYPPSWCVARDAVGTDVIDGYRIPAGVSVFMAIYLTHRRSDVWPDPGAFAPERFAAGRRQERHPFSYLPFGGGQHKCIGASFAMTETVLAVAMIVRAFELRLAPNQEIHPISRVTLIPSAGIRMHLMPRGRPAPYASEGNAIGIH